MARKLQINKLIFKTIEEYILHLQQQNYDKFNALVNLARALE